MRRANRIQAIRDTFFANISFFWTMHNTKESFKLLRLSPSLLHFRPKVEHPDLPMRQILRKVLFLLTVIILKGVSESIFFQSDNVTTCKFKDGKEVVNSLMVFNLLNIIHPFKSKIHLRTK